MKFYGILILAAAFAATSAITCYECTNARSDEQCMLEGQLSQCQANEGSCHTEVRFSNNRKMITKRCKQELACDNNEDQVVLNNDFVCDPNQPQYVCYCCCQGDACNADSTDCGVNSGPPPTPGQTTPLVPQNDPVVKPSNCGKILGPDGVARDPICTDGDSPGSVCAVMRDGDVLPPIRKQCVRGRNGLFMWIVADDRTLREEGFFCAPLLEPKDKHSSMSCTDGNNLGSRCVFQCDLGYVITPGSPTPTMAVVQCGVSDDTNEVMWNGEVPECQRIRCEGEVPRDFVMDSWCSDANFYGSECHFECMEGYGLSAPEPLVTCLDLDEDGVGDWDVNFPTCEPLSCPPFEASGADVVCSDAWTVNSTCIVLCKNSDHVVFPSSFDDVTCYPNRTWSAEPPCCQNPCPPHAPMDMVVVMDSSSTITPRSWFRMKQFVHDLTKSFYVGENATNFAIFRYNIEPDQETEIKLNSGKDDKELENAIDEIPKLGRGTWTGVALHYAADYMLHPESGNRAHTPDLVVVITDGQNNKKDDVPSGVRKLQAMGASVMVVAVQPEKLGTRFTYEHLVTIAGGQRSRVFLPAEGSQNVLNDIKRVVTEEVCDNICHIMRPRQ